ncbi:MAG: NUDIX hydrolase [Thermanaerothrix sp.]|jgi:ADP-ribose pyrophosphatase YjhB (NUDIX family)|uniref:NUDIX hydrolase n=1 Tax=Thermanaerothrix sp. TaxID=2972675 RepID=UPI003C7DD4ED
MSQPKWLEWAQRLQALAQSGLAYTPNPYDAERYRALQAIAAEIIAAHSDVGADVVAEVLMREAGYATPKVDIRGVVFDAQGRLLLVKERVDGGWTLPGGWVDVGEPPSQAVEREVWEESGYRVRAIKLLALYDRNFHGHPPYLFHLYKIFMRCELLGGEPQTSLETDGVGFFTADAIPPLSLARTTPDEIQRMFEHYRHPEWPADFD